MRPWNRYAPVLTLALIAPTGLGAQATAQAPSVDQRTEVVLREMETLIYPGVQPTKGKRVFTRMFDTHSSVHAHWAAYRIARAVPSLQAIALASEDALRYDKLRYEVANWVTYTYARAWFLRLATEYEKWAIENGRPAPSRMRPVADEVAQALLGHFSVTQIDPLASNYNSTAWAFTQLHQYLGYIGNLSDQSTLDGWIQQYFLVDIAGTSFKSDLDPSLSFFSTFGNWHHLIHTTQPLTVAQGFWQLQDPIKDKHLAVNRIATSHSYGMGWSRLWSLRSMADTTTSGADRRRFLRSANAHLALGMQRHYQLKGDFLNYDHWVGQFAVYAVTVDSGF
ncbi:MAG: hypothetical protein CMJ98_01250 [Planctomycetes bacterium]|nr:hypothetical protein [Planctomycetota bacterium]HJM58136.1 DUF2891 family protein [Planctomycetota bacterium]